MSDADIPIVQLSDDRLGRGPLVKQLAQMLVRQEGESRRATRLSVGLTGAWGSGKSSVLRLLAEHLRSLADVLVIEFNPWVFQSRDDLIEAFFGEMRAQLGKSRKEQVRAVVEALDGYREAIEPTLNFLLPGAGLAAKAVPRAKGESALAKRRALEERLQQFDGAVVVLIDELDRVEDDEIRAMARLVKAVGDLPNISYLIGYDRARVEAALASGGRDDGGAYLEKIVQFPVPIRPLAFDEVREMLAHGLRERGYDECLNDQDLMDEMALRLGEILDTPRDVKRLVSAFAGMEPMVRGEINLVDLLGYATLCTKAAAIRDKVADNIDDVVNNPADILGRMRRRRMADKVTIEEIFGALDETLSGLLKFLFPILGAGSVDQSRFGRIQHRRNLLTMLYLGDPPFQASHKEVAKFWRSGDRAVLERRRADGTIMDFIGLIPRLMPRLPEEHDEQAWGALANEVGRGTGRERSSGRHLGRELRDILVEVASRSPAEKLRVRSVIEKLISAEDFFIVPDVLRYHMFAHGLVPDSRQRGAPVIFDEEETKALLSVELPRYRASISSGEWLTKAHDTDVFFALEQGGGWDEELREDLEVQLNAPSAVVAFAELMTPPGWSKEKGTLDRFISVERLSKRVEGVEPPDDPWLAVCLKRLRTALQGEDPDSARSRLD